MAYRVVVWAVPGRNRGADLDTGFGGKTRKVVFDLVGSGNHQGVDLVDGLGAGLDRRTTSHRQHPDGFDWSVASFGRPGGLAVESSPRGGLGVGGVGLAESAAELTVRAVHFHHLNTDADEVAGQAGAVAAGALYPDPGNAAV